MVAPIQRAAKAPSNAALPPHHQLNRILGNRAASAVLQAKLNVSHPEDAAEREANQIADQITAAPSSPTLQRACPECRNGVKCPKCREKEKQALHRRAESNAPESAHTVPGDFVTRLGPGAPLATAERDFFEPRLGCDLSQVRIHSGRAAADSARSVDAMAYTVGRDIVFGAGQYAPQSSAGRSLMAHELVHTIQQGGTGSRQLQRRAMPFNPESIAQQLREAMEGLGTDEDSIYAALAGRTPDQVNQIAQAYQRLTHRNLQADLQDELTSGELLKLAQYSAAAADTPEHRAEAVAIRLREAMEGLGTDEDAIYAALNGRSPDELNAIKEAYRRLTNRELINDLNDELSGDELQRALGELGIAPEVFESNTELGMLSMGNFDFHFRNCSVLIWVWLKFQFTNDISATEQTDFKRRFIAAVHGTWAHSGYHLTGSPSCPCGDVPIEVHVQENPGTYYHKLVDVERATDQERRPKVISDINVNLFTSNDTLAHEFGHVLGLYDEYDGGFFENIMFWHKNVANDPDALMVTGTELRPRYFEHYRRRVQTTAPPGCEYRISSPVPPVH